MGLRATAAFHRNDGMKWKVICILYVALVVFQPSSAVIIRSGFVDLLVNISPDDLELLSTAVNDLIDAVGIGTAYGPSIVASIAVQLVDTPFLYFIYVTNWNVGTCNLGLGGEARNPVVTMPGPAIRGILADFVIPAVEELLYDYVGYGFAIHQQISLIYFPVQPIVWAILRQLSDNDPASHRHDGSGSASARPSLFVQDYGNRTLTSDVREKDSVPPPNSSSSFSGTTLFSLPRSNVSRVSRSDNFTTASGTDHNASNTTIATISDNRKFPTDTNGDCEIPSLVLMFGFSPDIDDQNTHGVQILNPTDKIFSPNGRFVLVMQIDCNLVLYDTVALTSLWSSVTDNQGSVCYAAITMHGELIVYDQTPDYVLFRTYTWCSSNQGKCWTNTILEVQDDGNTVLYIAETGVPLWDSKSVVCDGGC